MGAIMKTRIILSCLCLLLIPALTAFAAESGKKSSDLRIGQMIMAGFRGTEISPKHHIYKDIQKNDLGGVILFDYDLQSGEYGRNITGKKQLEQLCGQLQKIKKTQLIIAVDQEGGKVRRLKEKTGFPPLPSAEEMGEMGPEYTYQQGEKTGKMLSEMGINLDFAPVADVNVNPQCPVIGKIKRSFSKDPKKVTANCRSFISGLNKHEVAGCLKHFPGHGSSKADSHMGIADVTKTWSEAELYPYSELINTPLVFSIMPGHVFNARLDEKYPASLSSSTLSILRDKLGYEGVIITDDLQMKAIADHFGLKTTILKTIEAGSDILLFGNNIDYDPGIATKAIQIINDLIREGKLSRERIETSLNRIERFKSRLGGPASLTN
jgi:beta-N-acetylhexosaminidase